MIAMVLVHLMRKFAARNASPSTGYWRFFRLHCSPGGAPTAADQNASGSAHRHVNGVDTRLEGFRTQAQIEESFSVHRDLSD
jgi:hypothetical protein